MKTSAHIKFLEWGISCGFVVKITNDEENNRILIIADQKNLEIQIIIGADEKCEFTLFERNDKGKSFDIIKNKRVNTMGECISNIENLIFEKQKITVNKNFNE